MRFDLRYGAGFLPLEITGRLTVDTLRPTVTEVPIDVERSIIESLERPIDSDSFSQILSRATSFAIVVNGHQDFELNSVLLNAVLENIRASISSDADISVFYPIDSHRSGHQLEISEELIKNHQLVLHDSKSQEDLSFVGETPTHCTPIFVNKMFMDAEVKIGIGTIRSDVFVSATGGRMSVLPHCSGIKSISRNSKLQATHPVGPFVSDSAVCTDLEEASRLACLDFIINTIPDWNGKLTGIVAGNPYTAWENGVSFAKNMTQSYFQHKADIAIVSAGGSLNDGTFYDAVDALHAGREVTDHGGVIVLVAECPEGPGPDGFVRGVSECNSSEEVSVLAETAFEIGMEKSRFFWDILNSRKVIVCSRMRESLVTERFHCASVRDPQEGFELAKSMIVSRPRLAVIPDGNRILPVMKNS
ncbi:MAG: lactate racemase domain-containing protein [Candidatus Thorarchaeota archaeon]